MGGDQRLGDMTKEYMCICVAGIDATPQKEVNQWIKF